MASQYKSGGTIRVTAPLSDAFGHPRLRGFTFHHLRLILMARDEYRPGER